MVDHVKGLMVVATGDEVDTLDDVGCGLPAVIYNRRSLMNAIHWKQWEVCVPS